MKNNMPVSAHDNICFICGEPNTFKTGYKPIIVDGRPFEIRFCTRCFLGKTDPIISEKELTAFYSGPDYRTDDLKRFIWPFESFADKFAKAKADKVEAANSGKGTLLDIGCGKAEFISEMKSRGWKATGIDIDPRAEAFGKAKGQDVRRCSLEDTSYPDNYFDVITLWNVLEHLRRPDWTMKECARILKPGGLLVVSVPNTESVQSRSMLRSWFQLDPPIHLFHYSQTNLRRFIGDIGFDVKNVRHFSLEFAPLSYMQSIMNVAWFRRDVAYDAIRKGVKLGFPDFVDTFQIFFTLPVLLPFSLALAYYEALRGRGGIIEVYSNKR